MIITAITRDAAHLYKKLWTRFGFTSSGQWKAHLRRTAAARGALQLIAVHLVELPRLVTRAVSAE